MKFQLEVLYPPKPITSIYNHILTFNVYIYILINYLSIKIYKYIYLYKQQ